MASLDELERLLAEATPAPWREDDGDDQTYSGRILGADGALVTELSVDGWEWETVHLGISPADEALILGLRNAAPHLLALARAAEKLYALNVRIRIAEPMDATFDDDWADAMVAWAEAWDE